MASRSVSATRSAEVRGRGSAAIVSPVRASGESGIRVSSAQGGRTPLACQHVCLYTRIHEANDAHGQACRRSAEDARHRGRCRARRTAPGKSRSWGSFEHRRRPLAFRSYAFQPWLEEPMHRLVLSLALTLATLPALPITPAQALNARSWVASFGSG